MKTVDNVQEFITGLLSVIIIGGALVVTGLNVYEGKSLDNFPQWLTLAVGAVLGLHYGQRGVQLGVAKATNGMYDAASKMSEATTAATVAATNAANVAKSGG